MDSGRLPDRVVGLPPGESGKSCCNSTWAVESVTMAALRVRTDRALDTNPSPTSASTDRTSCLAVGVCLATPPGLRALVWASRYSAPQSPRHANRMRRERIRPNPPLFLAALPPRAFEGLPKTSRSKKVSNLPACATPVPSEAAWASNRFCATAPRRNASSLVRFLGHAPMVCTSVDIARSPPHPTSQDF